jgi:carboxyl-terminal processing protease
MVHNQMTAEIKNRTIEQYIKSLDPLKSYFTVADVQFIKTTLKDMDKWLVKQECGPIDETQKLYVQRVTEMSDYAKEYIKKGFKLDRKTTLQLDAQKKSYAKNKKELEDFQSKYIQFQVANFIASDMKEEEAKGWVERRYERSLKRLKETPEGEVYASFLNAFANALDPHSTYYTADGLEDFNIHMNLSLEGIGATLSSQDGYTVIEQLIPGGAAATSGELEPQDKIIAVAQGESGTPESVIDMPLNDVVKLIRGPKGTKVNLTIMRKGPDGMKTFKVTLTRQKINLDDEAAQISYINREVGGKKYKIGILNLPSFYFDSKNPNGRSCYKDVKRLLKEAQDEKIDGLVLDLSQNGGGSLEDAVRLTGLFIKTGNIVKTQGAKSNQSEILADTDPEVQYTGPLIVLTSRLSASASEILAGALKDYGRAIVVGGDHTFGKGSVQTVMPLPKNLGAYKVTIGMFYVPGGKTTQHDGVSADIKLPSAFELDEIGEKSLDYSLTPKKIPAFLSPEAYVEKGEGAWRKVDSKLVADLKKKSEARVAKNEEFKKIQIELQKTIKKGKVVTLSDILDDKEKQKEQKEKKAIRNDPKKRLEEYLKRPDVNEAADIMTDWLVLHPKEGVVAQKNSEPSKAN